MFAHTDFPSIDSIYKIQAGLSNECRIDFKPALLVHMSVVKLIAAPGLVAAGRIALVSLLLEKTKNSR